MTHKLTGDADSREVYLDGKFLNPAPSQKHHNHSPDGFNWGYGGSGPAQLALAIMLKLTGKPDGYQDFKFRVIAAIPGGKDFEIEFDLPALEFKTEWTADDFKKMEKAILDHFWGKPIRCSKGAEKLPNKNITSFFVLNYAFGLAYTSSGVHACYSICNLDVHYDATFDYKFFIMTTNGTPYAELWDRDEKEKYIAL